MKCIFTVFSLLLFLNVVYPDPGDPQLDDELYLSVVGGTKYTIEVEPVDNLVYGYWDAGYPFVSIGHRPSPSYTNNIGYDFNTDISYAKYKITINGDYIYADFRDCDFDKGHGQYGHGENYRHPDMVLRYYPSLHKFESLSQSGGGWRVVLNHGTVRIWEDGRKINEDFVPNTCFGIPATPTGFDSNKKYIGNGQYNPKLTWNLNNNYDISGYQLHRRLHGGAWHIKANFNHPTNSYIDYGVVISDKNTKYAQYRLKAKDWGDLYSGFTHTEVVRYNYTEFREIENNTTLEINVSSEEFSLQQNSPNPFNPTTNISFTLPEPSNVKLTIFDILGKQIDEILLDDLAVGTHKVQWNAELLNGNNVPTGIYIYKIDAVSLITGKLYSENRKMEYVK